MRRFSKTAAVLAAAMLVAGLTGPAAAGKPDKPGKPDRGGGLEVAVEPVSIWMVANSLGDVIDFAITVTNGTENDLEDVTVTWDSEVLDTFNLVAGDSWSLESPYEHTVSQDDIDWAIANPENDDKTPAGTVTASAGDLTTVADAVFAVGLVEHPCEVVDGSVKLTATDERIAACWFTADADTTWTLTTQMAKQHPVLPSTVRDGIPGNWCMGDPVIVGKTATQVLHFPAANADGDIVCADGGAGGESIPVRNANTFYLETWAGNTVTAEQNH